jgi:hypothetical protein
MANDNTLGAPTEGLGQTVTFAFGTPGGVPQLSLADPGNIRTGVTGGPVNVGGTTPTGVSGAKEDRTMEFISAIADPIVKAQMEKKKAEAFVVGMQRAAAGEAVADIAAEQPWYAKLYGDSDVVEGARVYASQTIAQTAAAEMEDQMPMLRELNPQQAQKFFIDSVNSKLTGHAATDASVMQSMSRVLPGVMRRQTKEHYGFLQENATKQETAAFRSGAKNLQAKAQALGDDYRTSDEFKTDTQMFLESVMPAQGRDLDSYKKSMTGNLRTWAQEGSFHALNAVKDSGFFEVLDPDQVVAVEKAWEQGEANLRNKYSFDWNDKLTSIRMASDNPVVGSTPRDIAKEVDGLNNQYSLKTGSRQGLITPEMRTALISGSARQIQSEIEKQANRSAAAAAKLDTEGKKAEAEAMKTNEIMNAFSNGNLAILNTNPGYGKTEIDSRVFNPWKSMTPANQVKALVANDTQGGTYIIEPVQRVFEASVNAVLNSETFTPQAQETFARYKMLREANPHTAAAYYGEHAKRLEGLYNDIQMGMAPEGAFRARFTGPAARADFTKDQMAQSLKVIGENQNWFMRLFTGTQKMGPGQQRRIANEISEETKQWYGQNGDMKLATELALKAAKRNGLEVMGGFAWKNDKNQQSLESFLMKAHPTIESAALGTDKINEEFYHTVNDKLYGKSGVLTDTASDVGIFRMADKAGVPQFRVQAVSSDGTITDTTVSGTDVFINSMKRKQEAATKTLGIQDSSLRAGPENKFAPKDDAPSIYKGSVFD